MTSMLHAFSSTFTTCACGTKSRDCALSRLAEFVDGSSFIPSPQSPISPSLPHESRSPRDIDKGVEEEAKVDLGPLVGTERGFRTREKVPMSGGMGGVEMVNPGPETEAGPSRERAFLTDSLAVAQSELNGITEHASTKGKGKQCKNTSAEDQMDVDQHQPKRPRETHANARASTSHSPPPPPLTKKTSTVPPRLRKGWIREKAQDLRRSPSPPPVVVRVDSGEGQSEHSEELGSRCGGRSEHGPRCVVIRFTIFSI